MNSNRQSWQSTVIGLALIALAGTIFLIVYWRDGIDVALKAWAAIGTVVSLITGAMGAYFFGTVPAREQVQQTREELQAERQAHQVTQEQLRNRGR